MTTVIHPTSDYVKGLWLFDNEGLEELDGILDDAEKELGVIRKRDIENTFKRKQRQLAEYSHYRDVGEEERKALDEKLRKEVKESYEFSRDKREIAIDFVSKKKLIVKRFSEALTKPDFQNDLPTSFKLELRCGRCEIKLDLPDYNTNRLQITVSPQDLDAAAELYVKLKLWAEAKSLRPVYRYWQSLSGLQWLVWAWAFLMTWWVWFSMTYLSTPDEKQATKAEARQLLDRGLQKEDEHKAIELMLRLAADYPQGTVKKPLPIPPRWLIVSTVFSFLLCLCLRYPPVTTIGIGQGNAKIDRQRNWLWLCNFLLVGFFFLCVGGSFLASVLYDFLKG
jgi:hypothetical protein